MLIADWCLHFLCVGYFIIGCRVLFVILDCLPTVECCVLFVALMFARGRVLVLVRCLLIVECCLLCAVWCALFGVCLMFYVQ